MKFTKQQQHAIELRDKNILVSAAAGSGKTAVLVRRIISRIVEDENPIDIDRILVMTFTHAAADQMKERILGAIEEAKASKMSDPHLMKQAALVHNAHISTIHGFCLDVIRNHFHEIDLAPDFRVADEGELRLLKQDVLEEVLEAAYEKKDMAFLRMTESLASQKDDVAIEDYILRLYNFSMSHPDSRRWLLDCEKQYDIEEDQIKDEKWFREFLNINRVLAKETKDKLHMLLEETMQIDGPYMYKEAIQNDLALAESIALADSYHRIYQLLREYKPVALGREKKNGPYVDPDKKTAVKNGRDGCKEVLLNMRNQEFAQSLEQCVEGMKDCKETVKALVEITIQFLDAYEAKKREKNIVDFNDLEHLTLEILRKGKDTTAKEYREYFEEIYVDEYQDSNRVQEELISLIARGNNCFMVGDVKQSIYSFRQATPELFIEKYDSYPVYEEGKENQASCERIDLSQNFRSRAHVIESVNEMFAPVMKKNLGGLEYDAAAELKCGANYPNLPENEKITDNTKTNDIECQKSISCIDRMSTVHNIEEEEMYSTTTEVMLIQSDTDVSDRELEAKAIAKRIRQIMRTGVIYDKKTEQYRKPVYGDFVILLRTNKGWDEIFKKVLLNEGIPVFVASQAGYFSAPEVSTILEFLKVIDNPLQDIPFAATMKSVIGGFTDEELAIIHHLCKKPYLYYDLCELVQDEVRIDIKLQNKIRTFLELLGEYREYSHQESVYDILKRLIDGDYGKFVMTMPNGRMRLANLNMLLNKAQDYGKTSYKGLFHFVRYIEFLHKYEVDFGEANILEEGCNTVRIMSIHKSKGLEFPICFLAGMSKTFHTRDASGKVVMDADYGIGISKINLDLRTKSDTLLKRVISQKKVTEILAEEMRILYVAMTRAEEKLIMTGVLKNMDKTLSTEKALQKSRSYLDFMLYANKKTGGFKTIVQKILTSHSLIEEEILEATKQEERKELLSCIAKGDFVIAELSDEMKRFGEELLFCYPRIEEENAFSKISVSELKKRSQSLTEDSTVLKEQVLYEEETLVPYIPQFAMMKQSESIHPTVYGSAFHRMLEIWDYRKEIDDVEAFFEDVIQKKRIEPEYVQCVRLEDIKCFLKTEIAARMKKAFSIGKLFREQPFVIGMYIGDTKQRTLVQGIIDAYFIEDGKIVVVDYKTDRIYDANILAKRYHVQLEYYAQALCELTGLPIKEKILYSACQKREIKIQ